MGLQFRWICLLYIAILYITQIASKELRVVCYYTNWSVYRPGQAKFSPQNINPYLCTHLVYAFGGFTKENTLKPFDKYQDIEKGGYAKFTGLKTYNKNLKTMLAIGGWNEGSSRFSPMVANAERRKELVKNVVKFLRQNHFDGLDLDWEYPSFRDGGKTRDRDNYAQLVQELREEFERESEKTGRPRLLLTMAVPAGIEYINKGYDVPKLMKYLDWMNILSYDYHSAFEPSVNHHAPLYPLEEDNEYNYDTDLNIDHTIKHYLKAGAISDKLVLGIPTYGRSYTLFNPDANDIGAPADGPGEMGDATRENGYLAYYEICEGVKSNEWTVVQPNDDAMGPYAYKEDQWVGYDDEAIARKKAQYVAEKDLGGIMFWAIDNDDFRGTCHNKPYPIIEAAKEALVEALGFTEENAISKPAKPIKSRGRTRAKPSQPTIISAAKERTQNSGGRQSSGQTNSRRRLVNRVHTTEKPETSKPSRRRRPVTKKPVRNEEPSANESGSSLIVTTPSYKTPEPPTTPDPGGDFKCEDEGFYPHPRDCKKYFWCLSGPSELGIVAHQFTCPAGLYFNKAASSCDYTQNVLCNKKIAKSTTPHITTANEKPTTESTKTPDIFSSLFTTRRPLPKITAATSRTTFVSTTTTEQPEYEEEYEYEDDVQPEENTDSEDPKVIKELLELIKKAGGIEELEKQLYVKGDSSSSTNGETTTKSVISKKLYERVLAKTKLIETTTRKSVANKYNTINRNSRGPQNEGILAEDKSVTKSRNSRPQYSTITRQRSSKINENQEDDEEVEDEDDDEDEVNEKKKETSQENTKKYVTLRRNRPNTAELKEDATKEQEHTRSTTTSRSPYVTLKRSRPTTASTPSSDVDENDDEDEDDDHKSSERKSIHEDDIEDDNEDINAASPKYSSIQRKRPTTTESSTSKYKAIYRSTTALPEVTKPIEQPEKTSGLPEISLSGPPPSDTNILTNNSDITNPTLTDNIEETADGSGLTSANTTKLDLTSTTPKIEFKPPQLLEPRPFSINPNVRPTTVKTTTTEKVTAATKVSYKPLLRSRPVDAPDSNHHLNVNNSESNSDVITRNRAGSRGTSRFTVASTRVTSPEVDVERHFRPDLSADISDLSSLTAVDFSSFKDFSGTTRRHRGRITPAAPQTTTEAGLKTGIRALPLVRKSEFGANKRRPFGSTASPNDVTTESNQSDIKIKRPFKVELNESEHTTKVNRKIIRRYRPTTAKSVIDENVTHDKVVVLKPLFGLNRNRSAPIPYTRRIKPVAQNIQDISSTEDDDPEEDIDEEENIKLSESNILENSDLNRVNSNSITDGGKKGHTKVIKRIKFTTENPTTVSEAELTESTIDTKLTSSPVQTTEPNIIIRTRKIVRKIGTTTVIPISSTTELLDSSAETDVVNSTDANSNIKRKIIRRLRPGLFGKNTDSAKLVDNNKDVVSEKPSIPINRVKVFKPFNKFNINKSEVKIENVDTLNTTSSRPELFDNINEHNNTDVTTLVNDNEDVLTDKPTVATNPANRVRVFKPFNKSSTKYPVEVQTEEDTDSDVNINTTSSTVKSVFENNNPLSNPNYKDRYQSLLNKSFTKLRQSQQNVSDVEHLNETSVPEENLQTTTIAIDVENITLEINSRLQIDTDTELNQTTESNSEESNTEIIPTTEYYLSNNTTTNDPVDVTESIVETTTFDESTETMETTLTPEEKPSTPAYVNKIYKMAGARPKLDLRLRLTTARSTTTGSVASTKTLNRYESRSRKPIKFRPSTEATRFEEFDDVGYGTVKPFKKLFNRTAERSRLKLNGGDEYEYDDDDIEEEHAKPIYASTTHKTYVSSSTLFNRGHYSKPTEKYNHQSDEDEEYDDEEYEDEDDEYDEDLKNKKPSFSYSTKRPLHTTTRRKKINSPFDSTTKRSKPSTRGSYKRFTSTTPLTTTQNLTDINIEALNNRNKQLFNKTRKMNTPHPAVTLPTTETKHTTSLIPDTTTESDQFTTDSASTTDEIVTLSNEILFNENTTTSEDPTTIITAKTTTERPTTFYHIFAETEPSPTTASAIEDEPTNSNNSNKVEKIIEVNRIVEINGRNETESVLDHIGAINRVTVIKIVDGNNNTNETNIKPEININGPNVEVSSIHREDRKYEIRGIPDIINAKNVEIIPNQITIDSKSYVKTNTPKPLFTNEVSTISLEGLFRTDSPLKYDDDELLDTEHSRYVNVKILDQNKDSRTGKETHDAPANFIPIRVLPDEGLTMKADVVEITRPLSSEIIKIAPISVTFQKKPLKSV